MLKEHADKAVISLKKTSGQINHIQKLIDENAYCMDIAQQINSAIGLLKSANEQVILSHLKTCGAKKLNNTENNASSCRR